MTAQLINKVNKFSISLEKNSKEDREGSDLKHNMRVFNVQKKWIRLKKKKEKKSMFMQTCSFFPFFGANYRTKIYITKAKAQETYIHIFINHLYLSIDSNIYTILVY